MNPATPLTLAPSHHRMCVTRSTRPPVIEESRSCVPPTVAGANECALPDGVMTEEALGIHHCNLFGQRRVQEALKTWLTEA